MIVSLRETLTMMARLTLEDLLAQSRRGLRRSTAAELRVALQQGRTDLVVLDTRTPTDRARHGCIEGSIHAPRTTLEWRVDPTSAAAFDIIDGFDQTIVVVCNQGYSSSLAAATLQQLGFANATDLVDGMVGWIAAGFPVVPPVGDEIFLG